MWVTSVRTRREDRSLHRRLILSQTSAGLSYIIDSSPYFCSFVRAWRPFLRPDLRLQTRRAQGRSRLAVAQALPLASMLPGHALTAPSTARGLRCTGRHRIGLVAREGASLVENRPGDSGELVGQRNSEHVVVQSLLRRLDPRLEPIAFPLLGELDQHDPGRLNEQDTQIAIAAPGYAAEDCPVSRRDLFRDQPEPGAEVAGF